MKLKRLSELNLIVFFICWPCLKTLEGNCFKIIFYNSGNFLIKKHHDLKSLGLGSSSACLNSKKLYPFLL